MRMIRVNGFGQCPKCLHRKLTVATQSPDNNKFFTGEIITCDKCGTEGVVKTDQYGDNFINWAERYKTLSEAEQLAAELRTLILQADMPAVGMSLQVAYARSTSGHSQCLSQAQGIINKLALMKAKGLI